MGDPGDSDQGVAPGERDKSGRAHTPAEPDKSADELDVGWGERTREPDHLSQADERLLRERPPHWE